MQWKLCSWITFSPCRQNRWKKRGMCIIPTKFGISFTVPFLNQVCKSHSFSSYKGAKFMLPLSDFPLFVLSQIILGKLNKLRKRFLNLFKINWYISKYIGKMVIFIPVFNLTWWTICAVCKLKWTEAGLGYFTCLPNWNIGWDLQGRWNFYWVGNTKQVTSDVN